MIFKPLFERYVFKEICQLFGLFLFCFFLLYVLIDYSLRAQDFAMNQKIHLSHLLTYYGAQFVKRADLLLPLALLIATLKVLFGMNVKGELIALQSCGICVKRILRPLFILGICSTLSNFVCSEWLLPKSLEHLACFRKEKIKSSRHQTHQNPIQVLTLKEGSKLLYGSTTDTFYEDVFWIVSADELWHMQKLSQELATGPMGSYVDHFKRNKAGLFEKLESFDNRRFDPFKLEQELAGKAVIPLESRSISDLTLMLIQPSSFKGYGSAQIKTHLFFKLAMPFLSLLVIFAAAPLAVTHSRNLPVFFTYALALFSFISFCALIDGAVILAESSTLSPYVAILAPFALCFLFFGLRYRMKIRGTL